jgi:hypothetical protein
VISPPSSYLSVQVEITSGLLMILVGLGTVVVAKWMWRIQLRWLWCGALLWAIAVEGKRFIAGLLNQPLLEVFQNHLPNSMYLALGSSYIGLLTGITEPVVTLAAGLLWRQLTYDARRAVGIGLGAGAFEAVYFGLMAIVASGDMIGSQAGFGISVLVPVAERLICIPCHAAVRAMTLYAIATGRWSWFWGGFAIFSAMDGIAGFYHLSHTVHTINPWLIELSFFPFSVISVLLLRYLWQHWPSQANTALEPPPTAS